MLTDPDACGRWAPIDFDFEGLEGDRLVAGTCSGGPARGAACDVRRQRDRGRRRSASRCCASGPITLDVLYELARRVGAAPRSPPRSACAAARASSAACSRRPPTPCWRAARCAARSIASPRGRGLRGMTPTERTTVSAFRCRPDSRRRHRRRTAVLAPRVSRRYGDGDAAVDALRGVSLDVPRRAVPGRHGPVGLRQVDAHARARRPRPPDAGSVEIGGRDITRMNDRAAHASCAASTIGFVFQSFNLLPTLTRRGERPAAAHDRRPQARRATGRHAARARRPRRPPPPPPVAALRRPAAARRRRARAGRRADRAVRRRADRQPRLARQRRGPRPAARRRRHGRPDDRHGHARRRAPRRSPTASCSSPTAGSSATSPTRPRTTIVARRMPRRPMIRLALAGCRPPGAHRPDRARDRARRRAWSAPRCTLTDTMRSAADSPVRGGLRRHRRRRRRRPRSRSTPTTSGRRRADDPRRDARPRARGPAASALAVGDIIDQAKVIGTRRQGVGDGPVLRRRARPDDGRRAALTPVPPDDGRWADRPRRGRHRRRHAPSAGLRTSATAIAVAAARPARSFTVVGIATLRQRQVARHGDGGGLRPATRRRALFGKAGRYDAILVAGRPASAPQRARALAAALPQAERPHARPSRTASRSTGCEQFISIIKVVPARVRRRRAARRRVHDLQHAVDHRRPAHARARRCCGWSAPSRRQVLRSVVRSRRWRSACSPRRRARRRPRAGRGLNALFDGDRPRPAGDRHGVRARARSSSRCSSARSSTLLAGLRARRAARRASRRSRRCATPSRRRAGVRLSGARRARPSSASLGPPGAAPSAAPPARSRAATRCATRAARRSPPRR